MQHNLVGGLRGVGGVALAPVVADSVGEDASGAVESSRGDGAADGRIALQTVLGVLVPEVEGTVATGGAEGTVDGVERDGVDRVDVTDVAIGGRGLAVALEGEVGGLVLLLDVVDGAATLDTADGVTGCIAEAADYPRLPLERGLIGLVDLGRVVEIDHVDVAVSGADHQQLVFDIHAIDALLTLQRRNWGLLSQIPVLDRLVPRAGDEKRLAAYRRVGNHVAASNRGIVGSDLSGGGTVRTKVQQASSFISTGTDDLGSVLRKKDNG